MKHANTMGVMGVRVPVSEVHLSERSLGARVRSGQPALARHCPATTLGDLLTRSMMFGVETTVHEIRIQVGRK